MEKLRCWTFLSLRFYGEHHHYHHQRRPNRSRSSRLDFAIEHNIPHGGWCPKGRKALDGPLGVKYLLNETPSSDYPQRTEWNVRDSDATVAFTLAEKVTGGSKKSSEFAKKHRKPWIQLHPGLPSVASELPAFIQTHSVKTLNVAGSRESKEPGLYEWVFEVLGAIRPSW